MLDDLRSALRYFWNVDSNSPETTLGRGRKVIAKYLPAILLILASGLWFEFLEVPDAALLSAYTFAPFVLDSGIFLESLPLISRVIPRATILVELGLEIGAIGVGISLSVVYGIIRKVGAASMALSWFRSKRN